MTLLTNDPGLWLILAGIVSPFAPRMGRWGLLLGVPVLGLVWAFDTGGDWSLDSELFGLALTPVRVDSLSYPFLIIFLIAAFLNGLYSLHHDDRLQHASGLIYAGSGVGAVLAGDLATLFIHFELMAISSVFLIWARRTERAYRAGVRYLVIQIGSGVLLMIGAILFYRQTGSLVFDRQELAGLAAWLMFLAFAIKCAFPLLHNWLQDAYPEATVTGTVVLSAFTTKFAVYAFARMFPGESILIPIGAIMTACPVFLAVIENDLRRVLAFSLNNQLGFMIVGIGIGSEIAINGAVSHAFAHIIYKALLFMSMGAVLYRVGTVKASELGGLHKSMPWTTVFCIVGAISIAGFPLTSGFVTKTLTLVGAEEAHLFLIWLVLIFASAGVMEHSGIKIPYFAFFAHDSGKRVREAPINMLLAMGIAAAFCIGIGIFPGTLYALLPYEVHETTYTAQNIITKTQLLVFAVLAFTILVRTGLYPKEIPSTNLNTDWIYRVAGPRLIRRTVALAAGIRDAVHAVMGARIRAFLTLIERTHGPHGIMARTWSIGSTVLWVAILLAASLILYYQ